MSPARFQPSATRVWMDARSTRTTMLYTANTLRGYTLASLDGHFGRADEFYFDDHHWAVRYLVADTGTWLTDRQVLISPYAITAVQVEQQRIAVNLTNKQIEDSPSLATHKPVSRQFEETYHGYYGWPTYWSGPDMWGYYPLIPNDPAQWHPYEPAAPKKHWDKHLRSTRDVKGHHIQAADGEIGHVDDFIIDDETWAIRYLVIDTWNWWPGKRVLISPRWIDRVSWDELKVFVDLTREAIKQAPEYTEGMPITTDYEAELHQHYHRPGYWVDEAVAKEHAR